MTAYSMKYFRENMERIATEMLEDCEEITVTLDSGQSFTVIPTEEYASWKETQFLLSNPAMRERLLSAIERTKRGEYVERDLIEP